MLRFEYQDKSGDYIAAAPSGFTVKAERDQDARHPWDNEDGLAPIAVYSDRDYSEKGDMPNPLEATSDSWLARHWRAVCDIFNQPYDSARVFKADNSYFKVSDARRDLVESWLSDEKPGRYGGSAREYMRLLAALYELRGWPVYQGNSRGYCQGDWAELLLVMSPAESAAWGCKMPKGAAAMEKARESLKAQAALWGFWAWGNVYGFVIEDSNGDHIDSCWGFYGDDFEESGLAEMAESALAYRLEERRRKRQCKAKDLIRARVPLAARAAILEGFPL